MAATNETLTGDNLTQSREAAKFPRLSNVADSCRNDKNRVLGCAMENGILSCGQAGAEATSTGSNEDEETQCVLQTNGVFEMKALRLQQGFVVVLAAALIAPHRQPFGHDLVLAQDYSDIATILRQELQTPFLHHLAIARYRMVRRIELKKGYVLSNFHGFGSEAIFPSGTANVVFWLELEGSERNLATGNQDFIQCFRLRNNKLIAGPRVILRLTNNMTSGHPKNLLSFLKMRGCVLTRNLDGRPLQELKTVRRFVGYQYDRVNDFLKVETEAGPDYSYELPLDPVTRERFKTPELFFQKYGLPPSETEVKTGVTATLRGGSSAHRP